jgi:hypothetical protein
MYQVFENGFFDELTKIAAETSRGDRALAGGAGALGGLTAAGAVGQAVGGGISRNLMKDVAKSNLSTSAGEAAKLRDVLSPGTHVEHLPEGGMGKAMFIPKGGLMGGGALERSQYRQRGIPDEVVEKGLKGGAAISPGRTGAHTTAHELGHARLHGKKYIGNVVRKGRALGGLGMLGATAGAAIADPDSTTSKAMPLAGLAAATPTLADEAYASIKGHGALKRMGYDKQALKHSRRQLAKAFGTYGGVLLPTAVAAPYLARKIKGKLIKMREEQ